MDLVDLIKAKFLGKTGAIQTEPGKTYGPSEDRYTHTPITFQQYPGTQSGEYLPPSILQKMFGGKGDIYVDPNKPDIPQTIRHEATHAALLQNLNTSQINSLNHDNPFYNSYIDNLTAQNRQVSGPTEVPAYAAENFNIQNPDLRNKYIQVMNSQLQSLNPSVASVYSRLAK